MKNKGIDNIKVKEFILEEFLEDSRERLEKTNSKIYRVNELLFTKEDAQRFFRYQRAKGRDVVIKELKWFNEIIDLCGVDSKQSKFFKKEILKGLIEFRIDISGELTIEIVDSVIKTFHQKGEEITEL